MTRMEPLPMEEAIAAVPKLQASLPIFEHDFGFVPNSLRTMARRPYLVAGFVALSEAVMGPNGTVPGELKHLVSHIASKAAGCRYCQAHTIYVSNRNDIAQARLTALWEYKTSSLFTDAEKAALDFALAAATVPNGVTDELFNHLSNYWTEGEIVEILAVVSMFGFLNRWNDSMATPLEEPAAQKANQLLGEKGWEIGKHKGKDS